MTIHACWVQHGGELGHVVELASGLRKLDVVIKFVATFREEAARARERGLEADVVADVFADRTGPDAARLTYLDKTYGPPFLRQIAASDVNLGLVFSDEQPKVEVVAKAYAWWERYFAENKIDVLLLRETATYATRTAYNIARARGRPMILRPDIGPSDSYFTLCDVEEHCCWEELLELLDKGVRPLTKEEEAEVASLVADRTRPKSGPAKLRSIPSVTSVPKAALRNAWEDLRTPLETDPMRKMELRAQTRTYAKRAFWKAATLRAFPYEQPIQEPYVYFPLFFEREAMTLANHHFWANNQAALIREVANALPEGYALYVKEHPAVPGEFSIARLREIREIPCVKLIHPLVQGQSLVRNASCVVLLSGSAGWEAFLLRKPVIALGSHMYTCSRLVHKLTDVTKLSEAFHRALQKGERIYSENEDEWRWYIHCLIRSSRSGTWITYEPPYFEKMSDPSNLDKLAAGIHEKIREKLTIQDQIAHGRRMVELKRRFESTNLPL